MNSRDKKNKQTTEGKQPYSTPVLRVYGNIQDLTRTTTRLGGMSDTRGPAMDLRTH